MVIQINQGNKKNTKSINSIGGKIMSEDREYYIRLFKEEIEKGTYYLYGQNPEEMTLEQLQDAYMNMINYKVDARTHTD